MFQVSKYLIGKGQNSGGVFNSKDQSDKRHITATVIEIRSSVSEAEQNENKVGESSVEKSYARNSDEFRGTASEKKTTIKVGFHVGISTTCFV